MWRWVVSFLSVIAALAVVHWGPLWSSTVPRGVVELKAVERIRWSRDSAFLRKVLTRRQPVVVEGAPGFEQLQSLEAVGRYAEQARNCMKAKSRTFFYYDLSHAFTSQGMCQSNLRYEIEDMSMERLIQRVQGRGEDPLNYYYYSSPLNATSPALYQALDFSPYKSTVAGISVNFWLASAGCVSRLHYDASHNLFMQLVGEKRFRLVSSKEGLVRLPLYPASHPCQRASAFGFQSDLKEDLLVKDVVLRPGDLLYIPPFYFHHVESLTPSSSLNMYLPSKEMASAKRINDLDFGISTEWLDVVQLSGLNHVLRKVAARVYGLEKVRETLIERFRLSERDPQTLTCKHSVTDESVDENFQSTYCTRLSLDKASMLELAIVGDRLSEMFLSIPEGTREILLLDWVETRILWVVDSRSVVQYLRNCFN